VFGEGSQHASLALVGEQPGDQEDKQGHPFVGPAGRILDRVRDSGFQVEGTTLLNRSQVAILRLVRRGHSNREIAAEVHLSENTVKTHLQDVFRKLGARNRVEAAMLAAERRWI